MPWLALPFDKRTEKSALSSMFGVQGIPTLVTIGPDGTVINKSARGPAGSDPTGASFPWVPKALEDIDEGVECNGFDVNEKAAVIVLGSAAQKPALQAAMLPIAEVIQAEGKSKEDGADLICFFGSNTGPAQQVRKLCGNLKPTAEPQMIILDIPDNGGYYVSPTSKSELTQA